MLKDFMLARNELRHCKDAPIGFRVLDGDGAFLKDEIKRFLIKTKELFGIDICKDKDFDKEMREIYLSLR